MPVGVVKLQCKYVCKWILLKCGVDMCASAIILHVPEAGGGGSGFGHVPHVKINVRCQIVKYIGCG